MNDRREYYKEYRRKNKETTKKKERERNKNPERQKWRKEYVENNKERYAKHQRNRRIRNPELVRSEDRKRYQRDKEKIIKRGVLNHKKRREKNPIYRMSENTRRRISLSFKENGYTKKSRTYQILGCTYEEFRLHLESKFEPWMNWDNYGKYKSGEFNYGWDVDHIVPSSSAVTEDDVIRLNHHSNLQPLCSYINRNIKKNTIK